MESSFCAFTFARNEKHFLPLWLRYYRQHADRLVVCNHGTADGSVEAAAERFRFDVVELDPEEAFNYEYTNKRLKEIQKELLEDFDWVLYADCDEFVVPDPLVYPSLRVYVDELQHSFVYCTGYDVVQMKDEEPLDVTAPILAQRRMCERDDYHYGKPLLSRVPLSWVVGTHRAQDDAPRDENLALFHLKRADWDIYVERMSARFPDMSLKEMKRNFYRRKDMQRIPEQYIGAL